MISFEPTDDEKAIREEVHRFAEEELRRQGRDCEKRGEVPDALRKTYCDLGLATLEWPESLGGAGLGPVARAIVEEELAWGDAGLAMALDGPGLAALAILELGSEEQKKAVLGRLAEPGRIAALALSEGDLGSEIGKVAAIATPAGSGGHVLSGRKLFVFNGPLATTFVVFAKIPEASSDGTLAAFVVDKDSRGLTLGREDDRIGLKAVRSCELKLDDVPAAAGGLLDRAAEQAAFDRFLARVYTVTAARSIGVARAALEYAAFYAQDRTAFGRKIGSFQGIAFKIADLAMEIDGARWLVWRAAASLAKGRDALCDAALACVHANDVAVRAGIDSVQVLGGAGYMEDYPVEKWMRDARALAMVGGSNPVRNLLAAEREYGPEQGAAALPDPQAAFAAFGKAFGG